MCVTRWVMPNAVDTHAVQTPWLLLLPWEIAGHTVWAVWTHWVVTASTASGTKQVNILESALHSFIYKHVLVCPAWIQTKRKTAACCWHLLLQVFFTEHAVWQEPRRSQKAAALLQNVESHMKEATIYGRLTKSQTTTTSAVVSKLCTTGRCVQTNCNRHH